MSPGTILPPGWKWLALSEIALINPPRQPDIPYGPDTPVTFVPMSGVSDDTGTIAWPETRPLDAVSKGYTYFEEGDVLFAKITPCMQNGKHAIARELVNGFGFGTTEFHVIRPGDTVTPDWIHRFLRQPWLLEEATRHFRGAVGQQRVPKEFLQNLSIPLPPRAEQKRIVGVLNDQMAAVERAKKAAAERLEAAQALREALLETMFDSTESLEWPEKRISDVCAISSRQVDPRLDEYKDLPHVNGENIESGSGRILYLKSSAELGMRSGKYLFRQGDVLYSKLRPYLRKATWVNFDGLCSADMYPLTPIPSKVTKEFLSLVLLSSQFTKYADEESKRSRMPKLNRQQLMRWKQRIPPIDQQVAIVNRLNSQQQFVDSVKRDTQAAIAEIEAMPSALLRRAFSGEV